MNCRGRVVPETAPLWSRLWGGTLINGDTASSPSWLDSWMNVFFYYIVITNIEEVWSRWNSYITFIPSQRHYLHCTCTSPSGCGNLAFPYQQLSGCPSRHSSGGSGRGPFFPSFPMGVTESYQSTNIENSIPFRRWVLLCSHIDNVLGVCLHLNILFFIQSIFYMYYDDFYDMFVLVVYIVYLIFLFFSLDYSCLYYVYIVLGSYSILYCSFSILFWSSDYFFRTRIAIYNPFIFCSSLISILKYKNFFKIYHDSFTIVWTYFFVYSLKSHF